MKTVSILFLFALLLTGCAQRPAPQNITWRAHQQQLESLTNWSLSGKVAVITPEERHSLNIHWQQFEDDFHITLTTFLGATILDIKKTKLRTQVTNSNGELFLGQDAEALIKRLSGLVIPIAALQQWIKGNPQNAFYQLDDNNQLTSLVSIEPKATPWSVNYQQYTNISGINLPLKLQLKQLNLHLKFVISDWQRKSQRTIKN